MIYEHNVAAAFRSAVAPAGDHSQSGSDGDSALWAAHQLCSELPQPEPGLCCTGDAWIWIYCKDEEQYFFMVEGGFST